MVELNKIAIGSLTVLLLVSLGFNVSDTDTHFCRELGTAMKCDRLSSTLGTCYPTAGTKIGSKFCGSGWESIKEEAISGSDAGYSAGTKVYICDQLECSQIQ